MAAGKPILARATAHLPDGVRPGGVYWVDASTSYIRECLTLGLLVPVDASDYVDASEPERE